MKYCGIATPYKGIRVYTRSAMGMPGSETCLEELMSRILGDMIQRGYVAKIADDLYIGGHTPEEVLQNWRNVLTALDQNNLRISSSKTIICPKSATILGWIWRNGTLQASPHKIAALTTVTPPPTVRAMRSFVGAYKVLSRVLHGYADLLDPLDKATAGRESKEKIDWTEDLLLAFKDAQAALSKCKQITIPQPEDLLWIITDGSVKNRGIAATMYVHRNNRLLLAGFFNAKLRKNQVTWLPCEIEALCIGAAIRHFAPFIIQSAHTTQVLTDSRPCVQAYGKLMRGEFSSSSRVSTFLSIASRYHTHIRHIKGISNLPSDFASRAPSECPNASCQICKFIAEIEDSVVRSLSVTKVLDGSIRMPFTSRPAWHMTQMECGDLRRTHSQLTQGTRPSKKQTRVNDVKRYLKSVTVASDGLLIVKEHPPFQLPRERIVVPRMIVDGLLNAIHIRFNHPSKFQMKAIFNRYFFALDIDKATESVSSNCHLCQSIKYIPQHLQSQSTEPPPTTIGTSFAADVLRRHKQFIFVLRESVSSYTTATLIEGESHEHLRNALLSLCAEVGSLGDNPIIVRVDPGPGFAALAKDHILLQHHIQLEIGHVKNTNKNPIAERAIEELGLELLHLSPNGGPFSKVTIAIATANLNARIRKNGLSSREIWTQRDQITGEQLPIVDRQLILNQQFTRSMNHAPSAKSKSHIPSPPIPLNFQVGHLVYIKGERNKYKARDKYMIVSISDDSKHCQLRKFTMSQFRSKTYDIKLSQCFPVQPTTLKACSRHPLNPDLSSDSDTDTDDPPSLTIAPLAQPPLPEAIVQPPAEELTDIPEQENHPPQQATRQSNRVRRKPFWQDDNWNISQS